MLAHLRGLDRIPEATVKSWLEPIEPVEISQGRIVLSVPNTTFNYTRKRYGRLLGLLARESTDLDGVVLRRRGLDRQRFAQHVEETA